MLSQMIISGLEYIMDVKEIYSNANKHQLLYMQFPEFHFSSTQKWPPSSSKPYHNHAEVQKLLMYNKLEKYSTHTTCFPSENSYFYLTDTQCLSFLVVLERKTNQTQTQKQDYFPKV